MTNPNDNIPATTVVTASLTAGSSPYAPNVRGTLGATLAAGEPPHEPSREPETEKAAIRVAADLDALPDDVVEQVNLDIPTVVTRALGFWPVLNNHIEAMGALPGFDVARIAKLRDYALALSYWQGCAMGASATPVELTAKVERAIAMREQILTSLTTLASYNVLDASSLARFGGSIAHRRVAQDLIGLRNLVHERWSDIAGRSMLTLDSTDEAMVLAESINQALGDRERAPAIASHAAKQRDKAFTLFASAYDEARRGVLFLRWHEDDADKILPSLYAGRRTTKKRDDAEGAPTTEVLSVGSVTTSSMNIKPEPGAPADTGGPMPLVPVPSSEPFIRR